MMNAMISLKEIGKLCGVSESTVSKALKDHPAVSVQTRQRVQQTARQHHYRPNAQVQSIQSGRSRLIGVAINDFGDPYSSTILRTAQANLHAHGYDMLVIPWDLMADRHENIFDRFACRRTDGLLLFPPAQKPDSNLLSQLKSMGDAIVLIDQFWDDLDCHYVGSDNLQGATQAVQCLLERGADKIAMVTFSDISSGMERMLGAQAALKCAGINANSHHFLELSSRSTDALIYEQIRNQFFAGNRHPDGLICFRDHVAMIALNVILDAGLSVPEDVQVMGFGNIPASSLCRPALSTMEQHPQVMGSHAAKLLLASIEKKARSKPQKITVPMDLIERQSTRTSCSD
jgi:LacI family transcriptional regulator